MISFSNGNNRVVNLAGNPTHAAAATWTDGEIVQVDAVLADLVEATGNNRLLRSSDGRPVSFVRQGELREFTPFAPLGPVDTGTLAWNGNGTFAVADNAFAAQMPFAQIIFHEIGHNWDEPDENRLISEFRKVAGWIALPWPIPLGSGWEQAGDGSNWWFVDKNTGLDGFADTYGKTNPLEDFATSFAAYLMAKNRLSVTVDQTSQSAPAVSKRLRDRFVVLDKVLASFV